MFKSNRGVSAANGTPQNQNHFAGGKNKNFDFSNFRRNNDSMQCRNCGSDYMRFSKDDLCQDCQQKAEFVYREKLSPSQRRQFFRKPVVQGATV